MAAWTQVGVESRSRKLGTGILGEGRGVPHLVEDVLVEVGHVALTGHGAIVVIPEVLLQGHGVMGDVQDRVQIVGQHLGQSDSLLSCTQSGLDQRTDSIGLSVHPHPALAKFSSGGRHPIRHTGAHSALPIIHSTPIATLHVPR